MSYSHFLFQSPSGAFASSPKFSPASVCQQNLPLSALANIQSRLMPPRPRSLPQALHIHLLAPLTVLVSLQPAPATARRAPAIAPPVLHTVRRVHRIPRLRPHLARLLVSRPPVPYTARQVHHTPLRVQITILKRPASSKVLRALFTVRLVRWVTHLQVPNSPLDRIRGPLVHPQVHRSGRLL